MKNDVILALFIKNITVDIQNLEESLEGVAIDLSRLKDSLEELINYKVNK